jgi:uroporphyrinogen-III decarboxylase
MTSRERVIRTLTFGTPDRLPICVWALPYAHMHHAETLRRIQREFPDDIGSVDGGYAPSPRVQGDPYLAGSYTDEWGCVFESLQSGAIGEIRNPILQSLDDGETRVQPPYETLPQGAAVQSAIDGVNRRVAASDTFILSGCCARPWERYQFLRGTENAFYDVMDAEDRRVRGLIKRIHDYYMTELEFWAKTDVQALMFMDDWGSQNQLLIPPPLWRALFKPLYKDYCDLARAHGKFAFMHSDGNIAEIYPDLVEIGVSALNSQVFCMDRPKLAAIAKGRMTFWGEIDRQHILPSPDPEVGRAAVREYLAHFYDPRGGVFAQLEFGLGSHPETVLAVLDEFMRWRSPAAG